MCDAASAIALGVVALLPASASALSRQTAYAPGRAEARAGGDVR